MEDAAVDAVLKMDGPENPRVIQAELADQMVKYCSVFRREESRGAVYAAGCTCPGWLNVLWRIARSGLHLARCLNTCAIY